MTGLSATIETALRDRLFPVGADLFPKLREAVEYAVFPGGKRLRPRLAMLSARAVGGDPATAIPAGVAVELIHCYSLVHDDLPAMDDDDLRRGRPTCHKVYGEAVAVLAGDALLTRAFEILVEQPSVISARLVGELARASGFAGMVGGQAADLAAEGRTDLAEADVAWIHQHKTADLLQASARMGAIAVEASPAHLAAVDEYASALGRAFQIVDDLLGRSGSPEVTGKPVGRDDERGKVTYPAAIGVDAAKARVDELTSAARDRAASLPFPDELDGLVVQLKERVS